MTSREILQSHVLDILFENRNKSYGAYVLRKEYNHRLKTALGLSLGIFLLFIFLLRSDQRKNQIFLIPDDKIVEISQVDMDNQQKPPENNRIEQPRSTRPVAQSMYTNQIELVNNEPTNLPSTETLINTAISNINSEGEISNQPSIDSGLQGNLNNSTKVQEQVIFKPAEIPPSYPGGNEALRTFLSRNLVVPDELEMGEKRTVFVKFIVGADGSISKIEIAQTGGEAFDKEVIRVLRKMPKWTPAIQNGHPVGVAFSLPVSFVVTEQ